MYTISKWWKSETSAVLGRFEKSWIEREKCFVTLDFTAPVWAMRRLVWILKGLHFQRENKNKYLLCGLLCFNMAAERDANWMQKEERRSSWNQGKGSGPSFVEDLRFWLLPGLIIWVLIFLITLLRDRFHRKSEGFSFFTFSKALGDDLSLAQTSLEPLQL